MALLDLILNCFMAGLKLLRVRILRFQMLGDPQIAELDAFTATVADCIRKLILSM